jgi:hypothetical protein
MGDASTNVLRAPIFNLRFKSSNVTLSIILLCVEVDDYKPIIKQLTSDVALDTITMRGLLIF